MTLATPTSPPIDPTLDYLASVLGTKPGELKGDVAASLPMLVLQFYHPVTIDLLGHRCLLLVERQLRTATPALARRHLELANRYTSDLVVLVAHTVDASTRAKLVAQRIPFIVPGSQMYLPDLAVDFREHFARVRSPGQTLTPAALLIVLTRALQVWPATTTPQALALQYGYSAMTMTRVADELAQLALLTSERQGRSRQLTFAAVGRALWDMAVPYLRSPVRDRVWTVLPHALDAPAAGLSALAAATELSEPAVPVLAIGPALWSQLQAQNLPVLQEEEPGCTALEIWHFDPTLLLVDGQLHPAAAWLTLQDNRDERVQMALESLLESVKW